MLLFDFRLGQTGAEISSRWRALSSLVVLAGGILFPTIAVAETAVREALSVETASTALMPPIGDHWLWVPDRLLGHSLLFDGDSGNVLGMIDSPMLLTPQAPMIDKERNEIYSVDVAHSRGLRGERVDFLTIYDLTTLNYKDEIVFPTKAATGNTAIGYSSRIGSRFVGVFNQFPATSISILDLDTRAFVGEIAIAGCSGLYAIDDLRFATLCGDGTVTVIELTPEGRQAKMVRSEKFFDTLEDPVFTSAGRIDDDWIFISYHGAVHRVDFSAEIPVAAAPWSLLGDRASGSTWRPGGLQAVAVHAASERLFVVMHEGRDGSHKDAGPEVWVFDLLEKSRLVRIRPPSLASAFLGQTLGLSTHSWSARILNWVLPADVVHSIAISQDDSPLLFMRNAEFGAIGVVDPANGDEIRILYEAGLFGPTLRVP